MLIYQSKVNLGENILFGNMPHLIDPEIRKMPVNGMLETKVLNSILVHDLPSIEIQSLHLKLEMQTSMLHKSWTKMERGILDSHKNPLQAFF